MLDITVRVGSCTSWDVLTLPLIEHKSLDSKTEQNKGVKERKRVIDKEREREKQGERVAEK